MLCIFLDKQRKPVCSRFLSSACLVDQKKYHDPVHLISAEILDRLEETVRSKYSSEANGITPTSRTTSSQEHGDRTVESKLNASRTIGGDGGISLSDDVRMATSCTSPARQIATEDASPYRDGKTLNSQNAITKLIGQVVMQKQTPDRLQTFCHEKLYDKYKKTVDHKSNETVSNTKESNRVQNRAPSSLLAALNSNSA